MHVEALVRMANQIGTFFEAMPDRPEALEGIATHIRKFWDPRMRRALLAHVDEQSSADELSPMVTEAISVHRTTDRVTRAALHRSVQRQGAGGTPGAVAGELPQQLLLGRFQYLVRHGIAARRAR